MQAKISAFFRPKTPNPPQLSNPSGDSNTNSEVEEPEIQITYKRRTPREDDFVRDSPILQRSKVDGTDIRETLVDAPIRSLSLKGIIVNKKRSYAQTHLSFGQSDFMLHNCSTCGLKYALGDKADEEVHKKFHKDYTHGIPFKGWTNERLITMNSNDGFRIVLVIDGDPPAQMNKVQEVAKMMENELGLSEEWLIHKLRKVYLFISSQRIAGCLVAEPIKTAYRVISNSRGQKSTDNTNAKATQSNSTTLRVGNVSFHREVIKNITSVNKLEMSEDSNGVICYEKEALPAICGIRAIYVTQSNRRKGVATKLLDATRKSFCIGNVIETSGLAFSQPSSAGKILASTYCGTECFLIYKTV